MIDIFKKQKFLLILILAVFIFIRFLGVHSPYHQDEYKWAQILNPAFGLVGAIPHPPLGEKILSFGAKIFGYDNLRFIPFIFGILNLILIYWLVKMRFGAKEALWSILLFTVSFYSLLASLMVDTDGQILPFFFLLSMICYYNYLNNKKNIWGALLLIFMLLGFLVKLSFIIAIGAIVLEFLYSKREQLDKKMLLKYSVGILGFLIFLAAALLKINLIFPNFNFAGKLSYWEHFVNFSNRGYLQIIIQTLKAVFYASPLLLLPLFLLNKELREKLRLFLIFLVLGMIFYLVCFDFSGGALDRYLQFVVVPLCIISGVVVADIKIRKKYVFGGVIISLVLFFLQFIPHFVPPQYPKTEWFSRVLHFKWNFLFPFSGGSGPLGFYVSWLFIALSWLASAVLLALIFFKPNLKKSLLVAILIIGLTYNFVFAEEYLFGKINGSPNILLRDALNFISQNKEIQKVTTYNDTGAYELINMGKYRKRIYIMPGSEEYHKISLTQYKEHYLVIDIPRINPSSIYSKYFSSCKIIFERASDSISAKVYDCRNAIDLK